MEEGGREKRRVEMDVKKGRGEWRRVDHVVESNCDRWKEKKK